MDSERPRQLQSALLLSWEERGDSGAAFTKEDKNGHPPKTAFEENPAQHSYSEEE